MSNKTIPTRLPQSLIDELIKHRDWTKTEIKKHTPFNIDLNDNDAKFILCRSLEEYLRMGLFKDHIKSIKLNGTARSKKKNVEICFKFEMLH